MSTTVAPPFDLRVAVRAFARRYKENEGNQLDQSTLRAGSAITYYCKWCGVRTQVLPESHTSPVKVVCDPCEVLVTQGVMSDCRRYAQTGDESILEEVLS